MAYPTVDVSTVNLDVGTDNPALARVDLLDLTQKFNLLRQLPADLASSVGASMLGYAPAGTGAVPTDIQTAMMENLGINVLRFFADGVSGATVDPTGSIDSTVGIQVAIACAKVLGEQVLMNGVFKTSQPLTITDTNIGIIGQTNASYSLGTRINYSGAGSAIICSGWWGQLKNFSIYCTNPSANGIEIGNASRHCSLDNIYIDGTAIASTTTGAGIFLNAVSGWSGLIEVKNCHVLQFKYGLLMDGDAAAGASWTAVSCFNSHLVGKVTTHVAGSVGFLMRDGCNGVGTTFYGGAIENFEVGTLFEVNTHGGVFECDFEGNATDYVNQSAIFSGRIIPSFGGTKMTRTPHTVPGVVWEQTQIKSGYGPITENYYASKRVHTYQSGATTQVENLIYNAASVIEGGMPGTYGLKFQVGIGVNDTVGVEGAPSQHFLQLGDKTIHWDNVSPASHTTGTQLAAWTRGSVCYNYDPVSNKNPGWICTASGTPGTWQPMVETAAWTPNLSNGGTITYTTNAGTYTKVGNQVTCWFSIVVATVSGGTGNASIQAPFAANVATGIDGFTGNIGMNTTSHANLNHTAFYSNTASVFFYDAAGAPLLGSEIAAGSKISGSFTFNVA